MDDRTALPRTSRATTRAQARRVAAFIALAALAALPAHATVFHVARAHPACAASGPGTLTRPYCSIGSALKAHPEPGNTFVVHPGVYREQVSTIPSGAPGAPVTVRAAAPGVILDGADDFSTPELWEPAGQGAWLARSVTWMPRQVFVGEDRLTPTTAPVEAMTANTWRAEPGVGLYVHLGGDNPGTRELLVGRRSHGIRVLGRSHVVLEGFTVVRSENRGIYVLGGSSHVVLRGHDVRLAGSHGIAVTRSTACTVAFNRIARGADHGIMGNEATGCRFEGNEAWDNARPDARAANGLNFFASTNNWVGRNVWRHNQDSGSQIGGGSHGNVFVHNVSWRNGDHGFDHLASSGNVVLGCVAWGNRRDGFSFEGLSPGNALINSIAVDNGLDTGHYDLWVDAGSESAFVSEANVIWNATGQPPVRWGAKIFAQVSDYATATGRDTRTLQADPRFIAPATGDFRLAPGSPAIDAADATHPEWPATDFAGEPRMDDPGAPDRGAGLAAYGDRGAFEHPGDTPPAVTALGLVTLDEGAPSWIEVAAADRDGPAIEALEADFSGLPPGADVRFEVAPGGTRGVLVWTPAWSDAREAPYVVTVRARNRLQGEATIALAVRDVDRAPVVEAPARVRAAPGSLASFAVRAVDPDGQPLALEADLSRLPAGHAATFTVDDASGAVFAWPVGADATMQRIVVRVTARNALTASRDVEIEIAAADDGGRDRGDVLAAQPEGAPRVLALSAVHPSPARGRAELRLDLPAATSVRWSVHDAQGRQCWRESRDEPAGRVTLAWSGAARAVPGVYFARVEAGGRTWTRRIVLTR